MKSSKLFTLALILGVGAATASADDLRNTIRIPQGRGQYLEVQSPVPITTAAYVSDVSVGPAREYDTVQNCEGYMRVVRVPNNHGTYKFLYRRLDE